MSTTFAGLGVPDAIASALAARGITEPFPIQVATIPDALAGRDLCGKAPTGSGKTIAFGVPLIARTTRSAPKRPHALVLVPTRELAIQVADEIRAMSGGLRVLAVYGGAGLGPQINQLRNGVDVVVACPGRLLDLIERNTCNLRDVSFAVVDEADRMADMGFLPDVRRILDQTPEGRQVVLFSATLDGAIDDLVKTYQTDPVVHEMPDEQTGDITHHFWASERPGRAALTADIVRRTGPTVVFCRTRHGSDRVAKQLGNAGVRAAAIHGNRSQAQRERALNAFHRGDVQALVATDVAARGIHVEGVTCVIHYDIPADHKDYVHRSGRTGRAGADGTVVALVANAQRRDAAKLRKAAGVAAELVEPVVDALPEAPREAFPLPSRRRDRPERTRPEGRERRPRNGDRRRSRDDRPGGERPARDGVENRGPRQERATRPDGDRRRSRDDRPADRQRRPVGDDRPARAGRDDGERRARREDHDPRVRTEPPSGKNRAERRQAAFGPPDSPERQRRAEARARAEASGQRPDRPARGERSDRKVRGDGGGRRTRPGRSDGGEASRADGTARPLPGAEKVRPSGASRRKAKRQALIDAGLPAPSGTKKRRTGSARPPRSGAARRG